mmetsp:Transcript_51879/g.129074  ORF Transcript_51879/g.129074 Transcript_51879/m.129074 type:complete len:185 (-) Transcript_51879:7-561(-)
MADQLLDMLGAMFPCCVPRRNAQIFSALDDAVAAGSLEPVRLEVATRPSCVHLTRSDDGAQPLHVAVMLQDADIVRLLLSNKAEVTATDKEGKTPLHYAALSGNATIAKMILEVTPPERLDCATHKGCSAMFLACWRGHLEIAQMLHAAGAKPTKCDKEGRTMMQRAAEWNHKGVESWLLSLDT